MIFIKRIYKNITVDKKINLTISVGINDQEAYIEITSNINHLYYYLVYPTESYQNFKNYIKIDNNYFYEDYIDLNIDSKDIKISGFLYYSDITSIKNISNFALIKKLNRYLSSKDPIKVISYHHYIDGVIKFNNEEIDFEDGIGYISDYLNTNLDYIFVQSNILYKDILEYKKIGFLMYINNSKKKLNLNRFKALLLINDQEYHFSSFLGYRLTKITKNSSIYQYVMKNNKYKLIVRLKPLGKLKNDQYIDTITHVTLLQNNKILFKQKLINCLYEKKITEK